MAREAFEYPRCWEARLHSLGWWHSFDLPDGRHIEGVCSVEGLRKRIEIHPIAEDLRGARVLDVGAWDGWYSFEMERRGAQVVAIDSWDNPRFHEIRAVLNSGVEYRQMDVYDLTPEAIGRFDIVLFMGVFYHLKHPLLALEKICAVTTEMAVVDSFILREEHRPGRLVEATPLMEFYEAEEFGGQADNWCAPNLPCLMAMCRTAGFARVEHRATLPNGAGVSCYRKWEPVGDPAAPVPQLFDAANNKTFGIHFDSARDEYALVKFRDIQGDATLDRVKPQVGEYGMRGIHVSRLDSGAWQTNFKLPPGLRPGWHEVTVRIDNGPPSNAMRIAVDLPSTALTITTSNNHAMRYTGALERNVSETPARIQTENGIDPSVSDSSEMEAFRSSYGRLLEMRDALGQMPPGPNTIRAKIGKYLIRAIQRGLFWYTPQIIRFQNETIGTLDSTGKLIAGQDARMAALEREVRKLRGEPVPIREKGRITMTRERMPVDVQSFPTVDSSSPVDSPRKGKRGKVALFTPLPPSETGTADYAADLILELEKLVDLHVFDRVPRNFKPETFDSVVYQIGNNPFHAQIYELALKHPGVVVLHEVNLHDLIKGIARDELAYYREVVYEIYGQELESLPKDGLIEPGAQPRSFTMIRRLLDRSKACIVHSRFAAEQVRMRGFRGSITCIPHGSRVRKVDGAAYRGRLGIHSGEPLVGMFGYLRPDKLACDCLLAFRTVVDHLPQAKLLFAGQAHPEVPLEERVKVLGLEDSVRLCGFQTIEDLDGYIAACDVVLNLRSPTYGETSGIMMRALGMAKTLAISANGASTELPDDICAKIPVDKLQNRVLGECLLWLLSDRKITAEIGGAAQKWVANTCSWDRVARLYADFLFPSQESPVPVDASENPDDPLFLRDYINGWVEPQSNGSRYAEKHMSRLVKTLQMTPRGNEDQRILEMGCYFQITPALRQLWGYGEVRGCYLGPGGCDAREIQNRNGKTFECMVDLFDAETDAFPYPSQHFQTVHCCQLLEYLQRDPMHMMREIHRVLKADGVLVLTTPNASSFRAVHSILSGDNPEDNNRYPRPSLGNGGAREPKLSREYSPSEIARLLSDSGFVVLRIETGPYSDIPFAEADAMRGLLEREKQSALLRDDCIFATARKAPVAKNRYPLWLYDE